MHLLRHRGSTGCKDRWLCLRCGRVGRKANMPNYSCVAMSYDQKVEYLRRRDLRRETIYTITACVSCDQNFFRLTIDIHRKVCYNDLCQPKGNPNDEN